jgi:hypothetical protein
VYLLIVMLAAGELSLRIVDALEGHDNPLFVHSIERVEEWLALSGGVLCANGVAALRTKLPELQDKPPGYEIVVFYEPARRHERRSRREGFDLPCNL